VDDLRECPIEPYPLEWIRTQVRSTTRAVCTGLEVLIYATLADCSRCFREQELLIKNLTNRGRFEDLCLTCVKTLASRGGLSEVPHTERTHQVLVDYPSFEDDLQTEQDDVVSYG